MLDAYGIGSGHLLRFAPTVEAVRLKPDNLCDCCRVCQTRQCRYRKSTHARRSQSRRQPHQQHAANTGSNTEAGTGTTTFCLCIRQRTGVFAVFMQVRFQAMHAVDHVLDLCILDRLCQN